MYEHSAGILRTSGDLYVDGAIDANEGTSNIVSIGWNCSATGAAICFDNYSVNLFSDTNDILETGDTFEALAYRVNGTAGASVTCSGGQFLQNQVVNGGIVTGGSCAAASGGSSNWQQDGTSANLLEPVNGSHTGILFGNDASLYRSAANTISTGSNDVFVVQGGNGSKSALLINGSNTLTGLTIGSPGDPSNLYKDHGSGLVLATDAQFRVNGGQGGVFYSALQSGDTTARWVVSDDGSVWWGDGSSAEDTTIFRGGAGILQTETSGSDAAIRINVDDTFNAELQLYETNDRGFNLLYDAGDGAFMLQSDVSGVEQDIWWVDRDNGATHFRTYSDVSDAFQIQDASGDILINANTQDGGVTIGSGTDFNDSRGNLRLWSTGTNGAGAHILFGDGNLTYGVGGNQNVWIGEYTSDFTTGAPQDSDALQLHGDDGFYFTTDSAGGGVVLQIANSGSTRIITENAEIDGLVIEREDSTEFIDIFAEVVNVEGTDYDFGTLQIGSGFEGSQILMGEFGDDEWAFRMTGNGELGSDGFYLWNIDQTDFALGFDGTGSAAFRAADSPISFQIQNVGGEEIFSTDTSNDRVYIGHKTADGTGTLLVLDTKNTSGDPLTGVEGAMYYNDNSNKFRCYQGAGGWTDCIAAGSSLWQQDGTFSNLIEPVSGSHTGILLGNDTNLYRSSSDTLRTDSQLIIENTGALLELRDPLGTVMEVSSSGRVDLYTADLGLMIQNYNGTSDETYMEFQGSDDVADWRLGSNAQGSTSDFFVYNDHANEYAFRINSSSDVLIDYGNLRVNESSDTAFLVEDGSGTDVFQVDTNGAGATGVTIGASGTQIEKVLHFAVDVNPGTSGTGPATVCATGTVTGAATSDRIVANPDPNDFTDVFGWGGARVSASNTIEACFYRGSGTGTDPGSAITVFGIIITP